MKRTRKVTRPESQQAARNTIARWMREVRKTVRAAGNHFDRVHDGMVIVRSASHRGLCVASYSSFTGRISFSDIT